MNLLIKNFFLFTLSLILLQGCFKDKCSSINCQNGGTCSSGVCDCPTGFSGLYCQTKDENCTGYYGSNVCNSSQVGISSTICCPVSNPFYCSAKNLCYTNCYNASIACSNTPVEGKYTGSGGSNLCNDYYGSSCSSSSYVRVNANDCCPITHPYYCSSTDKCYTSCTDANTVCTYKPSHGIN